MAPCRTSESSSHDAAPAGYSTVFGVLFIALIGNGYILLDLDPLYEQITMGVILLLAVGLDALTRRTG